MKLLTKLTILVLLVPLAVYASVQYAAGVEFAVQKLGGGPGLAFTCGFAGGIVLFWAACMWFVWLLYD